MNDNFIGINDMLNSDLIPELGNLQNGLEKITLDINGKITLLTVELTKKHEQHNKKLTFLTVLIIINIIITLSVVFLMFN